MPLPISLVLFAIGAVLVWGVTDTAEGVNLDAIGVILMVVGLIGFLISLAFWDRWGWGSRRRTYVEGAAPVRRYREPRRTTVVEEEVDDMPAAGPPPP